MSPQIKTDFEASQKTEPTKAAALYSNYTSKTASQVSIVNLKHMIH